MTAIFPGRRRFRRIYQGMKHTSIAARLRPPLIISILADGTATVEIASRSRRARSTVAADLRSAGFTILESGINVQKEVRIAASTRPHCDFAHALVVIRLRYRVQTIHYGLAFVPRTGLSERSAA